MRPTWPPRSARPRTASDVTAHRLGFEISESALIEAGGRSIEKLRGLTDLGVSLTIDDYAGAVGTDLIRELPTNALKISRRIIAGIPDDDGRVEAAEAAIEIARELGLATIANGSSPRASSPGCATSAAATRRASCSRCRCRRRCSRTGWSAASALTAAGRPD